jgi:hypothetical protein
MESFVIGFNFDAFLITCQSVESPFRSLPVNVLYGSDVVHRTGMKTCILRLLWQFVLSCDKEKARQVVDRTVQS